VPALGVSRCGASDEEARRGIRDAARGFLATSAELGTLEEILEEAGYRREEIARYRPSSSPWTDSLRTSVSSMPAIRPLPFQKLAWVFEYDGFRFHRQEGDQLPLAIPMYRECPYS
jgi:hypothetical protein